MTPVKDNSARHMVDENMGNYFSEATSACNSTAAQMGDDPGEAQGILENPRGLPSIHTEDETRTVSTPVTNTNLTELERQQEMFWTDPAKATRHRQEQSRKIREGAVYLGVDIASPVFRDVGQSLGGMTPMERFVDGKNKS